MCTFGETPYFLTLKNSALRSERMRTDTRGAADRDEEHSAALHRAVRWLQAVWRARMLRRNGQEELGSRHGYFFEPGSPSRRLLHQLLRPRNGK